MELGAAWFFFEHGCDDFLPSGERDAELGADRGHLVVGFHYHNCQVFRGFFRRLLCHRVAGVTTMTYMPVGGRGRRNLFPGFKALLDVWLLVDRGASV